MMWKCGTQYASKSGKLSSGHRTGKGPFFFSVPKEGNDKEYSNYCTIPLIAHTSKAMLKILQASMWTVNFQNRELPDVHAGFRKGRGSRDQIANICWIIEKAKFQKNIYCFIDYAKAFDYVDHNKLWKILKEMGIPDHLPLEKPICRSGSNS